MFVIIIGGALRRRYYNYFRVLFQLDIRNTIGYRPDDLSNAKIFIRFNFPDCATQEEIRDGGWMNLCSREGRR